MARDKELYLKDAKDCLNASQAILGSQTADTVSVSELRSVIIQLYQASNELNRLIGVLDAESGFPKN